MSSKKKVTASKPVKSKLVYNEKEVPESAALHLIFDRLASLSERELAGANFVMDLLLSASAAGRKLGQMQAQLDRIEGRLVEVVKAGAPKAKAQEAPAPTPSKKTPAPSSKKPSKAAAADVSRELADLEETVEQRQARMAKMEKEDKRKALALKKKQEELKAKKEKETAKEAETKAEPKKKRQRRRKKTAVKEATA